VFAFLAIALLLSSGIYFAGGFALKGLLKKNCFRKKFALNSLYWQ
jgi:hypothetical protein